MKRKGIEKGEKKRSSKDLVMIGMAAMVVMTAMAVFVPTAAAGEVTKFNITADNYAVNATTGYTITVNTTGYVGELTINITLPAGYTVNGTKISGLTVGEELAMVDIYEATGTGYYGNATIKVNGTDKVDVIAKADELIAETTKDVSYNPEASWSLSAKKGTINLSADVTLPAASVGGANGSLNASIWLPSGRNITNVSIRIGEFVKNPTDAEDYVFVAKVGTEEATDTVTVETAGLPKNGNINGIGGITLADVIYLAKYVGGFSEYQVLYADGNINGVGGITLADVIYLAKYVGGFSEYQILYP